MDKNYKALLVYYLILYGYSYAKLITLSSKIEKVWRVSYN